MRLSVRIRSRTGCSAYPLWSHRPPRRSRVVGKDQKVELLVGYPLGLPVVDGRHPRRAVGSIHLEAGIVVDHDHVVATPEVSIPAPRLEPGLYPVDVGCRAGDPVDVPPAHRAPVVAQNLIWRHPGTPDLEPVDDGRVAKALADHAPVKVGGDLHQRNLLPTLRCSNTRDAD